MGDRIPTCGAEIAGVSPRKVALKAGSRASRPREPGQVRKEAALSGRWLRRGDTWPEQAPGKALGIRRQGWVRDHFSRPMKV